MSPNTPAESGDCPVKGCPCPTAMPHTHIGGHPNLPDFCAPSSARPDRGEAAEYADVAPSPARLDEMIDLLCAKKLSNWDAEIVCALRHYRALRASPAPSVGQGFFDRQLLTAIEAGAAALDEQADEMADHENVTHIGYAMALRNLAARGRDGK